MKKKFYFFIIVYFLITFNLSSYDWPVEKPNIINLFGQMEMKENFSQSIIFAQADNVYSTGYGRHLISIGEIKTMKSFPSTLGKALIFVDDELLQSIYGNLNSTYIFQQRNKTEGGSLIGSAGDSAWSENRALIFQILDIKKNMYINPMLFLPPIEDNYTPEIERLYLKNIDNKQVIIGNSKIIKQGVYNIYAEVIDRMEKNGIKLSPFKITVLINGQNIIDIPFEVLVSDEKMMYLHNTKKTHLPLYNDVGHLHLGKVNFKRGKIDLSIIVSDKNGNEKNETYSFYVD